MAREPKVLKLKYPTKVGEGGELVEQLALKCTGRSMKDFVLPTKGDGTVLFEPYACAKVGVHMAGQTTAFLDAMDAQDVFALAEVVMDFFGSGPPTGKEPSQ